MENARISQLNPAGPLSGAEYMPLTQVDPTSQELYTLYTNPEAIKTYILNTIGDRLIPAGSIVTYGGTASASEVVPGWLLCDGSLVLRNTYATLFSRIGTTYGSTDSTNFRLPNLRGRVIMGYCNTTSTQSFSTIAGANWPATSTVAVGDVGGEFYHQITNSELPLSSISILNGSSAPTPRTIYNRTGNGTWEDSLNASIPGGLAGVYGGVVPSTLDLQFSFNQSTVQVTNAGVWTEVGTTGNNNSLTVRRSVRVDSNGDVKVKVLDRGWGGHGLTVTAYIPTSALTTARLAGASIPHNVTQPYMTLNYIIKY